MDAPELFEDKSILLGLFSDIEIDHAGADLDAVKESSYSVEHEWRFSCRFYRFPQSFLI